MSVIVENTPTSPLVFRASNIQDILAEIQYNPPGQDAIARVHRAIVDGTTAPTFRENTLREISQLSQTVLQIEQHFAEIAHAIRSIDSKQILQDHNGLPIKFFPEWNSYHKTYSDLLYNSQTTATQLKTKIDDLLINLIPLINDPHVSLNDKKEELGGFIEGLDYFQAQGTVKARDFQLLRENVKNFGLNLVKETKTQSANARERQKAISENISHLEGELKAAEGFFSACWSVLKKPTILGSISFSTGAGGFAGLVALAPVASTLLVAAGLGALGYGISEGLDERARDIRGKNDMLLALRLEQQSLQAHHANLKEVSTEVVRLTSSFNEIFNRLGTMQQIWTMIRSDAVGLQEAMGQMRNARTSAGFKARISNVKKLWFTLAWALDNYALGVSVAS
ncbi:hypothetical protein BDZ94DRAFT_1264870, partial [Collybia nuda]